MGCEGGSGSVGCGEPMKVTLTAPAIAGSYLVREQHADGTLVLRPETSEEVIEQFADRPLSEEEQEEMLRRLAASPK